MAENFRVKPILWVMLTSFSLHVLVAALAGNHLVSDETYYAVGGLTSNFEHPPLAKAFIALSISVLGNNWVAWRLSAILFSVLATYLTYKIAKEFLSEKAATYTAALLTLSVIFLWVGSTALLDIPAAALGLAGVYFVLRGRYGWGGLMFGLSFLCKELAVLMFAATFLYIILKKTRGYKILFHTIVAFLTAFVGLWIYEAIYQPIYNGVALSNPAEQIYYMIMHYVTLIRSHAWYPPISWVTPFGHNALVPLPLFSWILGNRVIATWVIQPNVAVEYMMLPLLVALPILYWKRKDALAFLSFSWLSYTYLPWLIVGFFVKTEVNYYITYSVPFLAIGSAYLWSTVPSKKTKYALATTQLIIGVIWFIYYLLIAPFRV